jgi:hypothetical protein
MLLNGSLAARICRTASECVLRTYRCTDVVLLTAWSGARLDRRLPVRAYERLRGCRLRSRWVGRSAAAGRDDQHRDYCDALHAGSHPPIGSLVTQRRRAPRDVTATGDVRFPRDAVIVMDVHLVVHVRVRRTRSTCRRSAQNARPISAQRSPHALRHMCRSGTCVRYRAHEQSRVSLRRHGAARASEGRTREGCEAGGEVVTKHLSPSACGA